MRGLVIRLCFRFFVAWGLLAGACGGGGTDGARPDASRRLLCSDWSCAPPPCCGDVCRSDQDCCPETVCRSSPGGDGRCYPEACDDCGGLTPLCSLTSGIACTFECVAPTSCGESCSGDAECGYGSYCNSFSNGSRRCVPDAFKDECAACGVVGCLFDASSCTLSCATPSCCLNECGGAQGCCPGTECRAATDGTMRCCPEACASCGGMRPICRPDANDCSVECVAPQTCGQSCTGNTECGPGSICKTFDNGARFCVPNGIDDECALCGSTGCRFYAATCELECVSDPPPGGPDGGGGGGGTDGGPGSAPDGGAAAPCKDCCWSCAATSDCCDGLVCAPDQRGRKICMPDECLSCGYGCEIDC